MKDNIFSLRSNKAAAHKRLGYHSEEKRLQFYFTFPIHLLLDAARGRQHAGQAFGLSQCGPSYILRFTAIIKLLFNHHLKGVQHLSYPQHSFFSKDSDLKIKPHLLSLKHEENKRPRHKMLHCSFAVRTAVTTGASSVLGGYLSLMLPFSTSPFPSSCLWKSLPCQFC